MEVNDELHALMRSWRRRLKCDEIPGLRSQQPNRRGDDVSQADMAWLAGATEAWYANLEQGRPATYSDEFLDRVASSLRLSPDERRVLYHLALGREPQPSAHSVNTSVQRVLDAKPSGQPDAVMRSGVDPRRALARDEQLRTFMKAWRDRLTTDLTTGEITRGGDGAAVSQTQLAEVVGYTRVWYGRLEAGDCDQNFSEDFLHRVAEKLLLCDDERRTLLTLAGRCKEPLLRSAAVRPRAITGEMEAIVHLMPFPAWISDHAWDAVVVNEATLQWFPHMREELNIMRYVFLYERARQQLTDWETTWAQPMLAQARAANIDRPQDARLASILIEGLEQNDVLRHLWDTAPQVHFHPDGDRRRLRIPPDNQEVEVEIFAATPGRDQSLRLVAMIPMGYAPPAMQAQR